MSLCKEAEQIRNELATLGVQCDSNLPSILAATAQYFKNKGGEAVMTTTFTTDNEALVDKLVKAKRKPKAQKNVE